MYIAKYRPYSETKLYFKKVKFIEEHLSLFESIHNDKLLWGKNLGKGYTNGSKDSKCIELLKLARVELHYSDKTGNADIFNGLMGIYRYVYKKN